VRERNTCACVLASMQAVEPGLGGLFQTVAIAGQSEETLDEIHGSHMSHRVGGHNVTAGAGCG
jgi:hypothetical protein